MNLDINRGDVLETLKSIPDNRFTAVLSDPPYGLSQIDDVSPVLSAWLSGERYQHGKGGFMNKAWDSFVPGPDVWRELLRTCKPGAVAMVYCGTRTADLMSISLRLGGWEKFDEIEVFGPMDQVSWLQSMAMPKSTNISKIADKRAGVEGEILETITVPDIRNGHGREYGSRIFAGEDTGNIEHVKRAPVTDEAKTWYGYGTHLVPAHEIVLLFRKPRSATFLDTALEHGSGMLNINGTRIGPGGRWPKNTVFTCCEEEDCNDCPLAEIDEQGSYTKSRKAHRGAGIDGNTFKSPKYESTVRGYDDAGGPSRFFYTAKVSRREKDAGLEPSGTKKPANSHSTLKPISLSQYLATMLLPPEEFLDDATLCVPYSGAGSEMIGAVLSGWRNVFGIELEQEYIDIAGKRLAWWINAMQALETTDVKTILKEAE